MTYLKVLNSGRGRTSFFSLTGSYFIFVLSSVIKWMAPSQSALNFQFLVMHLAYRMCLINICRMKNWSILKKLALGFSLSNRLQGLTLNLLMPQMPFFYLVNRFSINVPKLSNSKEKLGLLTLIGWENNLSRFRNNLKHDLKYNKVTEKYRTHWIHTVSPLPNLSSWATVVQLWGIHLIAVLLSMSWSPVALFLMKYMLKSSREPITRVFNAERYSFCTMDFENKTFKWHRYENLKL